VHLHRHDVVDKATQLLDDYGIADLTMRRLAKELSVTPGALYWHFANKQQLLGAVADRILEPVSAGASDRPWPQRIIATCSAVRDALLSSTDGAELVSASFASGQTERLSQVLAWLTAAAAEAGMSAANSDLTARTLVYYVLGFSADEQTRLQWDAAGALDDGQSVAATNPNGRFAFGLQLLVDGIAAQRGLPSADDGVDAGVAVPTP
jgi:TetR/AcrR family transcriptional regulator, tetracycline repressor protein